MIAEANALGESDGLVAGTTLSVPEVKTSSNDAHTFKPYNPSEITGPTSPGLPFIEPPDKGCGTIGIILMVAIAVVVAIYAGPAATGFFQAAFAGGGTVVAGSAAAIGGAMVGGAVAGAASAAASMAVGSAMGVASFSWRGVAAGAITGAIAGGLLARFGSVADALNGAAPNIGKAASLALANAGAGYAGQKLAGVDVSFSWSSIAASAVSSVVSAKLAGKVNLGNDFADDFTVGMAGGMVSAGVRKAMGEGGRTEYMTIVADAFGNALGNAAARGMQNGPNRAIQSRDLMQSRKAEDEQQLQEMIAYEQSLGSENGVRAGTESYPVNWGGYQRAPFDASSGTLQLDAIRLDDGLVHESWSGRRTYALADSSPVIATPLPGEEWKDSGVQGLFGFGRTITASSANDSHMFGIDWNRAFTGIRNYVTNFPAGLEVGWNRFEAKMQGAAIWAVNQNSYAWSGQLDKMWVVKDVGGYIVDDMVTALQPGKGVLETQTARYVDEKVSSISYLVEHPNIVAAGILEGAKSYWNNTPMGQMGFDSGLFVGEHGVEIGASLIGGEYLAVKGAVVLGRATDALDNLVDASATRLFARGDTAVLNAGVNGVPINGAIRNVPLGFESESQFLTAAQELGDIMATHGITDATVGVRGSSVTGFGGNPRSPTFGQPFGSTSDIDIFVESSQAVNGFKNAPGFIHPDRMIDAYPGLETWSQRWSDILGRPVSPAAWKPGNLPPTPAILVK